MEEKLWYLEKRAEQLAIVYLSRRDDLVIAEQHGVTEYGFDLLVSLTKNGKYTGRMFGVEVKALNSVQQIHRSSLNSNEVRLDMKNFRVPKDIPFPVCLFIFVMENDEGYYSWIKEPIYGREAKAQLLLNKANTFRKLDNEAISEILEEVNNWYDNRLKIPA